MTFSANAQSQDPRVGNSNFTGSSRFFILNFNLKFLIWFQIAHSVARLTPVRKVASSSPSASRFTKSSIPPWVCKLSTWQMMVIGEICAFQIGSLRQLGNQNMAALFLYTPQGVDVGGMAQPVCSPGS